MINFSLNKNSCQLILSHIQLAKALSKKFPSLPFEDRFQEACLGLVKASHSYNSHKDVSFGAYAKAVIINQLRQYYKKEKVRLMFVVQSSESNEVVKSEQCLSDESIQRFFELKRDLERQFGVIKIRILMKMANGKTQKECSQEFGVSQSTISRVISQARKVVDVVEVKT